MSFTARVSFAAGKLVNLLREVRQLQSLGFAIPLTFIALVAPAIRRRADLAACLTAGTIAVVGQPLPWKGWIILAAVGGILAGWLVHRHHRRRTAS